MLKSLRDLYLRIDARSLGLFRIGMSLVLIGDLFRRWGFLRHFYSNEGVLPNHNHIFVLHDRHRIWSALHAFSSSGENHTAFVIGLFIYAMFLVGYQTRAFHLLSVVALVSLSARNILLENAGNYAAIALLVFTAFLPLGSRFSLDALLRSMRDVDEKTASDLNEPKASEAAIFAHHAPGFSPTSLAAFAVLFQIAVIFLVSARAREGSWLDGTALHYALQSNRIVTDLGVSARSLPPGLLSAWTHVLRAAEWLVPVLVFVPFAPRHARGAAAALAVFYGLSLALLLSLGLYGVTMAVAALLLVPKATWDKFVAPRPKDRRTVVYDADCGVCLWLARILRRLDARQSITFQGNDSIEELLAKTDAGDVERTGMPSAVDADLVQRTLVVIDRDRRISIRSGAVAAVIEVLPFGRPVAFVLRLPGLSSFFDVVYDTVAERRHKISALMGKESCGIPIKAGEPGGEGADTAAETEVPQAKRILRFGTGLVREGLCGLVLVAMIAQTIVVNQLSYSVAPPRILAAVAQWPRMMGRWDVLAPEPSRLDELLVIDGQTRGGAGVDPLMGREPNFDPGTMQGVRLGQLWADYTYHLHQKEWNDFQRAFRDYLGKGGPRWSSPIGDDILSGYDAYWVSQPIAPPGAARDPSTTTREKLFTYSRGGRADNKAVPFRTPPPKH